MHSSVLSFAMDFFMGERLILEQNVKRRKKTTTSESGNLRAESLRELRRDVTLVSQHSVTSARQKMSGRRLHR